MLKSKEIVLLLPLFVKFFVPPPMIANYGAFYYTRNVRRGVAQLASLPVGRQAHMLANILYDQ